MGVLPCLYGLYCDKICLYFSDAFFFITIKFIILTQKHKVFWEYCKAQSSPVLRIFVCSRFDAALRLSIVS